MPGQVQFLTGQLTTPPEPKVDLSGKTIIVTGANSGLGLDAAKLLLKLNCSTIVLACRSIEKGEAAKQEILQSASPGGSTSKTEILIFPLEMTSFSSAVAFAERCKSLDRIDAAILNAGVNTTEFSLAEGYETTMTVNVISTFLVAILLLPILRKSAIKHHISPNIAIVGSLVHYWANSKALTRPSEGAILSTLSDPAQADMKSRYFLSKLPVILLVRHLGTMLRNSAVNNPGEKPLVILNNVAPGYCVTNLFRHGQPVVADVVLKILGRSSEHGARTLVHGGTAGKETHGQYLSECQVKPASPFVRSVEGDKVAQRIWDELVPVYEKVQPGCTRVI